MLFRDIMVQLPNNLHNLELNLKDNRLGEKEEVLIGLEVLMGHLPIVLKTLKFNLNNNHLG